MLDKYYEMVKENFIHIGINYYLTQQKVLSIAPYSIYFSRALKELLMSKNNHTGNYYPWGYGLQYIKGLLDYMEPNEADVVMTFLLGDNYLSNAKNWIKNIDLIIKYKLIKILQHPEIRTTLVLKDIQIMKMTKITDLSEWEKLHINNMDEIKDLMTSRCSLQRIPWYGYNISNYVDTLRVSFGQTSDFLKSDIEHEMEEYIDKIRIYPKTLRTFKNRGFQVRKYKYKFNQGYSRKKVTEGFVWKKYKTGHVILVTIFDAFLGEEDVWCIYFRSKIEPVGSNSKYRQESNFVSIETSTNGIKWNWRQEEDTYDIDVFNQQFRLKFEDSGDEPDNDVEILINSGHDENYDYYFSDDYSEQEKDEKVNEEQQEGQGEGEGEGQEEEEEEHNFKYKNDVLRLDFEDEDDDDDHYDNYYFEDNDADISSFDE